MTEEQERKLNAQVREFPETMALFDRVRIALAEQLFLTPVNASAAREDIYTRVQALDAMKNEMQALLNDSASNKAIREYAEQLAKPE